MNTQTVSHYNIIKKIGDGGMGEVYLAEDTRLHRQVALKILSVEIDSDKAKISRFKQEARAASALNHPNILTVYDIGETDSAHFIATEFVKGKTLRDYLNRTFLSWQKAVEIIIQVARALSAAHQVGVVHRDVKPENIMIRNDGYVKVLDFGLAKLTERKFTDNSLVITQPGLIMGTPRYMSPEQIRGYEVDERSDIFSLGVVFYEMISGKPPFEGATVSDVIAAVLQNEPPDVSHYAPGIPDQIEIILKKTLQKDRAVRYQTMAEMLVGLERFQQSPVVNFKDHQSVTLQMPAAGTERQSPAAETNSQNNIQTPQDLAELTATKYQIRSSPTTFPKKWLYAAGMSLAVLVLLPLGILTLKQFSVAPDDNQLVQPSPPAAKTMAFNRVTNNGKASNAAISPDGEYLAYALAESGKQSLWIKHLPTSKNMQIISPSDVWYGNLIFSADGNYIYYLREKGEISQSEIFMVPVLGGTPKKMAEKTNNSFSLSPDSKQFVFTRFSPDQEDAYLITAQTDGTGEKTVATKKGGEWQDYPAWSPDGKRIAFVTGSAESKDQSASIGEINLDNLQEKNISTQKWFEIKQIAWTSNGSGLVVIAKDQEKSPFQIWYLNYSDGAARRVTNDLNNYHGLSTAADSNQLVTIQAINASGIWTSEKNDLERSRQISSGSGGDGRLGIAWTPNGKIVYSSSGDAKSDIWIMDGDGSSQQQLTLNSGTNVEPSVSPDNRYIVFASDRSGSFNIWRMDVDGGNPIQLTNETGGRLPQCAPDGKWVIYQSHKVGKEGYTLSKETTLWKVPIDGGAPVKITDQPSSQPVVSPDGRLIAFYSMKEISVIPIDGGEPKKVLDVPHFSFSGNVTDPTLRQFTMRMPYFRWLSDSTGLFYVNADKDKRELWKIELNDTTPQKLGEFDGNPIYFDWSADGQKLAYSKFGGTSDVVTISDW